MTPSSWFNTSMFAIILAVVLGVIYIVVRINPTICPLKEGDLVHAMIGGPLGMVISKTLDGEEVRIRFTATNTLVEMKCFEVEKVINQKGK